MAFGYGVSLTPLQTLTFYNAVANDGKMVKFSILLYMILGSILMISFFFVLNFFGEESKMTLFYIRRFIIQPIFILLFIPAFYYQKQIRKS
jgi:exosortase F-associated protein